MEEAITDREFALFQRLIRELAGVDLAPSKKQLLIGRLAARLQHLGCASFEAYFRLLESGRHPEERDRVVDLLTTHETYFFREPQHFEFLRDTILPQAPPRPFRVWSAACSTGEEAYSIAMVLAEHRAHAPWEVFASDVSRAVLEQARHGCYSGERTRAIPPGWLRRHCLKGVRTQAGKVRVGEELRARVSFAQVNLIAPVGVIGKFDVIFLRNVLIYFDTPTRRRVIENLAMLLRPDGHLIVGHSESLTGITDRLRARQPTIYRFA